MYRVPPNPILHFLSVKSMSIPYHWHVHAVSGHHRYTGACISEKRFYRLEFERHFRNGVRKCWEVERIQHQRHHGGLLIPFGWCLMFMGQVDAELGQLALRGVEGQQRSSHAILFRPNGIEAVSWRGGSCYARSIIIIIIIWPVALKIFEERQVGSLYSVGFSELDQEEGWRTMMIGFHLKGTWELLQRW